MSKRKKIISIRRIPEGFKDKEVRQIFGGEGWQELTDALIVQLVEQGWQKEILIAARAEGAFYSKPRNSLIYLGGFVGD